MRTLSKIPRRMAMPADLAGRPLQEMIHEPLHSAIALNAAALPAQVNAFNYAIGQTVSGAGPGAIPATVFHTNMDTPGLLPKPRIASVYGLRVVMNALAFAGGNPDLSDPSQINGVPNDDFFDDLRTFTYSVTLRLQVGPKNYLIAPLFLIPGNVGFGGVASFTIADGTAAATHSISHYGGHTAGKYLGLPTYPVLLADQQSFLVEFTALWPTNPTMNDARYVWTFLDCIQGREVL